MRQWKSIFAENGQTFPVSDTLLKRVCDITSHQEEDLFLPFSLRLGWTWWLPQLTAWAGNHASWCWHRASLGCLLLSRSILLPPTPPPHSLPLRIHVLGSQHPCWEETRLPRWRNGMHWSTCRRTEISLLGSSRQPPDRQGRSLQGSQEPNPAAACLRK